jgi:hypothetical protein
MNSHVLCWISKWHTFPSLDWCTLTLNVKYINVCLLYVLYYIFRIRVSGIVNISAKFSIRWTSVITDNHATQRMFIDHQFFGMWRQELTFCNAYNFLRKAFRLHFLKLVYLFECPETDLQSVAHTNGTLVYNNWTDITVLSPLLM